VELINRQAAGNDNTNSALRAEVEEELLTASQLLSDEIYDVRVLELEGESNIICHYEILLNVQSAPSASLLQSLNLDYGNFADGFVGFEGKFIINL